MWLVILLFLLLYWLLYSPYNFSFAVPKTVEEEEEVLSSLQPQQPTSSPYAYFFGPTDDGLLTFSASYGGSWKFSIGEHQYVFDRSRISESGPCLGKPNGFKLNVRGKPLYDAILKKKMVAPLGYDFYFLCHHDTVRQIYACPPGISYRDGVCHAIDSCVDRENGYVFADPTDRNYYQVCLDEKPVRKRCQPDTFFWMDACRSSQQLCESEHPVIPIHRKKYIRCDRGVVEECPENTSILGSWKSCEPDDCVGVPDEFRKPMAAITRGPFVYSPGYRVCRENRIVESVTCPTEWHPGTSLGDDLTRLPTVFDAKRQACSIPSFCENVFSDAEIVVPAHEFTKRVPEWIHAAFFDSVVGYRCEEENKLRFALEPGKRILGNAVVSACIGDSRTKIPIGDKTDAYYDCESQSVIECGPDSIFDGTRCRKSIKNAHSYKNIPFFRPTGLSNRNDWLEPFPTRLDSSTCLEEQEGVTYFSDYDVCLVPQCSAYPFLKQIPKDLYFLLPDGKHICTYNAVSNTIRRKSHFIGTNRKLDFWNQRPVPQTDSESECVFGQNLKSGNFFLDSTIYVTCDENQPFVFCPSASTRGIGLSDDNASYACLPRDSVYEIHVEANETLSCLNGQVEYFQIEEESQYLVNGKKELGSEISSSGHRTVFVLLASYEEKYTFWSDRPYVVRYRKLPTYPPNVHLEKQSLVSGTFSSSNNWLIPIDLPNHTVEESIAKKIY